VKSATYTLTPTLSLKGEGVYGKALIIEIWNLFAIWCLKFGISFFSYSGPLFFLTH
jgi:hypothetical protein